MIYKEISIYTLIPEYYKIANSNNAAFETFISNFFDASLNLLKVPLNTTGNIKASKGEFTNVVTDNLIVKKQYTNLYENITTSNYDWYNTYVSDFAVLRSPDTSLGESVHFSYIDVDKPYYKIKSDANVAPRSSNLSQIVEIIVDASGGTCTVLLDPSGNAYRTTSASPGESVTIINTKYDASLGSYWVVKDTNGRGTKSWVVVTF